jgi:hypothetical protein
MGERRLGHVPPQAFWSGYRPAHAVEQSDKQAAVVSSRKERFINVLLARDTTFGIYFLFCCAETTTEPTTTTAKRE